MSRNQKKYLFDFSQSIENIFSHHLDGIEDEVAFENDITSVRVVEREFGIIGEAAHKLRKLGVELTNYEKFVNLRNTLVHRYDAIKSQTLWQYIQYDLPDLKGEVDTLLGD